MLRMNKTINDLAASDFAVGFIVMAILVLIAVTV